MSNAEALTWPGVLARLAVDPERAPHDGSESSSARATGERTRVLHLISDAGRSFYLRTFADHFDRQRFDFRIGSVQPAGILQDEMRERAVPTLSLGCEGRRDWPAAISRLASYLRRERIDVLQTHLFDACTIGLSAARLAGTPLTIFTGHHSHEVVIAGRPLPFATDWLCSRWLAHKIIAPSHEMRDDMVHRLRIPESKVSVLPYGFDLASWTATPGGRERVRQELGLGDRVVFGSVARLFWVKDYPSLFRAFIPVARANPDPVLLVVGTGPDEAPLRAMVSDLGLDGRVVFAGHRKDIRDVFAAMDVLVHSSQAESFCQVIVEAFAQERPVISTRVGVAREIIEPGVNGLVVPPRDTSALAQAMLDMLASRRRWRAMGQAGRRRIERFSAEVMVPLHEAQYRTWLQEAAANR
jgi:glycosyltransferase involved in cell wall biosynthesis